MVLIIFHPQLLSYLKTDNERIIYRYVICTWLSKLIMWKDICNTPALAAAIFAMPSKNNYQACSLSILLTSVTFVLDVLAEFRTFGNRVFYKEICKVYVKW